MTKAARKAKKTIESIIEAAWKAPTPDEVLSNPCASYWLKDALRSAMRRDPVDAAGDAGLLADVLAALAAAS